MYVPAFFFVVLCSFARVSTLGRGREGQEGRVHRFFSTVEYAKCIGHGALTVGRHHMVMLEHPHLLDTATQWQTEHCNGHATQSHWCFVNRLMMLVHNQVQRKAAKAMVGDIDCAAVAHWRRHGIVLINNWLNRLFCENKVCNYALVSCRRQWCFTSLQARWFNVPFVQLR